LHTDPAPDVCPRCGRGFHCGANDAGPCPCAALELGAGLLRRLRERFTGCLCPGCLTVLARAAAPAPAQEPFT